MTATSPSAFCENPRCGRPAAVALTLLDRGAPATRRLCVDCAERLRARGGANADADARARDDGSDSPSDAGPGGIWEELARQLVAARVGRGDASGGGAPEPVCPLCGGRYRDFRQSGRLGCPHDYEAFRDDLLEGAKRLQGATRHVGKIPWRSRRRGSRLALRVELAQAVALEDYERAAGLRDALREEPGPTAPAPAPP